MLKHVLPVIMAIISVFAPAEQMILTVLVLCLVDLITGILASKKQSIPITSYGIKRTIMKLAVYEMALCLGYLVGTYLVPFIPVTNIVSSVIGLTELKSVLENLDIIIGKPVLKSILDALQKGSSNDQAPPQD